MYIYIYLFIYKYDALSNNQSKVTSPTPRDIEPINFSFFNWWQTFAGAKWG